MLWPSSLPWFGNLRLGALEGGSEDVVGVVLELVQWAVPVDPFASRSTSAIALSP